MSRASGPDRRVRVPRDGVDDHTEEMAAVRRSFLEQHTGVVAEATTSRGHLTSVHQYPVGPLRYLRFNFTTGDAAGQNMTGRATEAACQWIQDNYPKATRYLLSGTSTRTRSTHG